MLEARGAYVNPATSIKAATLSLFHGGGHLKKGHGEKLRISGQTIPIRTQDRLLK